MAAEGNRTQSFSRKWGKGDLELLDSIPAGHDDIAPAITIYANSLNSNRQSRQWVRAVQWMENILFGLGRHYIDDLLVSRISRDSSGGLSVAEEVRRDIPRPTNDLLGRYIETNIALLTENRPIPRVTAKSDKREDRQAAELSELTLQFLWEELGLPEKHREMARILLYCGVCWLETIYDPLQPRYLSVQETEKDPITIVSGPGGPVKAPVERNVPVFDDDGNPVYTTKLGYGDVVSRVVSPFEIFLPIDHWWNSDNMGWIMKESYMSTDLLRDKYLEPTLKKIVRKSNGWHPENISETKPYNVQNLPLWWWERLVDVVEGPGPTLYVGTPEQWENYTVIRTFDRAPSPRWPKGRTIVVAGEKVIYDSPKKIGARAFDPRWPKRWHPYTRYRWEGQVGSMYGRSLVSKLLPKLKRINSIDTTAIMYRRTAPIATWIMPKGANPVEGLHSGEPGGWIEYDPRKTAGAAPQPVFAPDFPQSIINERDTQVAEMEAMAGTEEILRGKNPTGVRSAAMVDILRKQALASRSAILQSWDESLQETGTALLQETIKHVRGDPRYLERIKLLARETASRLSIEQFSGTNLSDNVIVRIDTASMAMVSREAQMARAIEVIQYAQGLMVLPPTLREKIVAQLGWPDTLTPQGTDINRAKFMIQLIDHGTMDLAIPMPEDDPYIMHEMLVAEIKAEVFIDRPRDQQVKLFELVETYRNEIQMIEKQQMQMQMLMASGGDPVGG